jgi:hypothetical protein
MTRLVPNRFLFDFEFPLRYRAKMPALTGSLADWTEDELLPDLGQIDGEPPFGAVWACWNEEGIAIACRVENKSTPLRCNPKSFWRGDNLRLCTDMRDTRNIHRASKHCQQFFFLPTGGGKSGRDPVAGSAAINRARQSAPIVPPGQIPVAARVTRTGYALEALVPAAALYGFDPTEHPRIGFYYILEDADHGQQFLTVGDDLYWHIDPSTWATAILAR